jgi:hypothetical protein
MSDEAKLGDVKPEETFRVHDGREIKNLKQYLKVLNDISDESFRKHVNEEKNDFANWIRHSIGDQELADQMDKTKEFDETKRLVEERIELLEKRVEIKKIRESLDDLKEDSSNIEIMPIEPKAPTPPDPAPALLEMPAPARTAPPAAHIPGVSHPFELFKKDMFLMIRDILIGFVIGLLFGYLFL